MFKFFSLFFLGLRKDLLNSLSYKIQFFGSFFIIYFNLIVYFYFLEFVKINSIGQQNLDYFKYIFVGLLLTDFSMIMVRSLSGPITTYKNQGIFEELMSLPISELEIIFNSLPYALFNAFLRLLCFLIFYFALFGISFIDFKYFCMIMISLMLFIICSCGVSLIFTGITLIFHRGEGLPFAYTAISTIFGGVFYPASIISDNLFLITNILPIKHIIEVVRGLTGISDYSQNDLLFNILMLFMLSIFLMVSGFLVWKHALKTAKKQGSLYIY